MGRSTGAWAVVACVALAACSSASDGGRRPTSVGPSSTIERRALEAPEGWTSIPRSPLSGRSDAAAAWTGRELVLWGGHGAFSDGGGGEPARTDGAAYDPEARRWRTLPDAPLPAGQNVVGAVDYASAWTGSELLVWGGPGPKAAAYDPKADRWRRLDPGPSGERVAFGSVWTGRELVVLGGGSPLGHQPDRADRSVRAYDPVDGTWRLLPDLPFAVYYPAVLWDGERILVFGPRSGGRALRALSLDPDAGSWVEGPSNAALSGDPAATWDGSDAFVVATGTSGAPAVSAYDPVQRRWRSVRAPSSSAAARLVSPSVAWTGKEVVVLGSGLDTGQGEAQRLQGWAYDPAALTWRALPPRLSPRSGATAVWADDQLLVWGGALSTGFTSDPRADGAAYRPGPGR